MASYFAPRVKFIERRESMAATMQQVKKDHYKSYAAMARDLNLNYQKCRDWTIGTHGPQTVAEMNRVLRRMKKLHGEIPVKVTEPVPQAPRTEQIYVVPSETTVDLAEETPGARLKHALFGIAAAAAITFGTAASIFFYAN